jgi:hypothetical protein|tara:strand:+ start:18809 stop:19345 length:537 start_codon:yes stop_codon:yes gene_type:complete
MGTLTIDGTGFEVYGTRASRDAYFKAAVHGAAYVAASTTQRDQAHVSATRMIDRQTYLGDPTSSVQDPSAFPRDTTDDLIPDAVEEATYELTLALLQDNAAAGNPDSSNNVKKVGAGSATVEFFRPTRSKGRFPTIVQELLRPYLSGALSGTSVLAKTFGSTNTSGVAATGFGLSRGQ